MKNIIAYYRVSTKKQEVSGLGLDAQKLAILQYSKSCAEQPFGIVAEYEEVESGKRSDRPQLALALQHAKSANATLVVAKLDRLARNVAFTSALMESGVDFVCCDMPSANRLTIHILAAVAEDEARRISQRTKDALAALKARGVKLGSANPKIRAAVVGHSGWAIGTVNGRAARAKLQRERYGVILPLIIGLRERGCNLTEIAATLNSQEFKTTRGTAFTNVQVKRILSRQAELAGQ